MASSQGSSNSRSVEVVELPEDYRELIRIYFETRAQDLEAIDRALGAADFAAIRRIGHNVRGSSASYGLGAAGEIGLALERAAEAADARAIAPLAERLRDYLARIEVRFVPPSP